MAAALKKPAYGASRFTYADYCNWDDSERWELIDGVPYAMAAPSIPHQRLLRNIGYNLHHFLRGKKCEVLYAPTDVRLNADSLDNTVIQPDILVVCDKSKLTSAGLVGAPDMAVEILSPSSAYHDTVRKHKLYMEAGVREFWFVDPESLTVVTYILCDGSYTSKIYEKPDIVPVSVLEGCNVDLAEVFEE